MRKILLSAFALCIGLFNAYSQNLSYNCPRTITVSCGTACITLNAQFPDTRALADDYTFKNISAASACFPQVNPGVPGTPTSISIDDTYSSVINLPFSFPFYGATYNSLVVSTNGYICFDITRAGLFSHYSTAAGNLPNTGYDRALIMGPYHDLNPAYTTSPTKRIDYVVVGTAPTRKWVLSFYRVPLFSTACQNLIENTHQIILNESSGVVEVSVFDKQICPGWNSGQSMIGMQNYNRNLGIMPPNRRVTDPPWGSIGMNESWRFIPKNGAALYRSVELLDATATVIATGDTVRVDASTFEWNFTNVCPPPNVPTLYVVKTTYQQINGPGTYYSLDTINVLRLNSLPATTTTNPTTCGTSVGSITVTPTAGTSPYSYTLNGGSPVTVSGAHTYSNLAAGPYVVIVSDANSCDSVINAVVTTTTTIAATISSTSPTCPLSTNGTITVTPTSGTAPYTYRLDGGAPQGSNVFTNVAAGPHTVTFTDANSCPGSVSINLAAGTGTITATTNITNTSCPLANDGSITVTPTSGTAPYMYALDGGTPQASNVFTNIVPGPHTITITDAITGCGGLINFNITAGNSGVTATTGTTPTTCPTLNDGTITVTPTSGTPAYTYRLDGGAPQGSNIFTNVSAGPHSVLVTDMFGCTGTFPVNVAMGSSLTSNINGGNPPCFNLNNGTITVNPTSGTAPYQYSLNGGAMQGSNIFTGLAAGSYTVDFIDFNGCTGTNTFTLTTNTAVTATSVLTNPLCNGNNNGSIVLNAAGGVSPYEYSINGGATYQVSNTFNGLGVGAYNFLIRDVLGCIYSFSFSLTEPTSLTLSALTNFATCPNNDGSIDITAGGGSPAYEYSIDNGVNYQLGNVFNNLPIGNYNNIRVRDANGCVSNTAAVVVLNDTMYLNLGSDSTICVGSSITLIPMTNALTDTFKWTPAATLNFDDIRTPIATPSDTTTYVLNAKWGICTRTDAIRISVLHKPVPFAGNDTTICYKTNAFLNGSASNLSGGVSYAWSPADSLNTPNAASTIARIDTTRKFYLTVTDNYGCNFTVVDSMMVTMQPQLVVFAGNDTTAIINRPHQMLASGGTNYMWSPAGPLNNPFIANPLAILSNDTYFSVLVTDAIGCQASDYVFVKVYEGPTYYLPNAFTPNGDGLNDIFRPTPVGMKSTDYFRVFNRMGQLMFQTNEWMKGWDGTQKGKQALTGTYVWMIKGIDKNGAVVEMKGTVVLIR